jgi:predicted AlkP superfamily phosphohydrolase/phosphomutase
VKAPRPRVLFIGFDAMDPSLVLEWAKAGVLPTFQSLMERGAFGPTRNPTGLFVGAIWPSFFTGVSPARHGRYCYAQLVTGTYSVQRFRPPQLKREAFWNFLSNAGQRVAIVDVPKSPLSPNLNGVQLQDWGTHDPDPGFVFTSWPPSLATQVTERFGSDPVGDCNFIGRTETDIKAFCENLKIRIHAKTAICRELLDQESWDLFLAVFNESHCVGHQCWAIHQETHPSHDPAMARAVGDPVKQVYVALDSALAELLLDIGPDTTVFVLASHGMGPHYDATFMLDDILRRIDPPRDTWKRSFIEWSRKRWHVLRRRRHFELRPWFDLRRCFQIPNNDVYGGIRVNLVGREPNGLVSRGEEYEALFAELRRELRQLVNVDTGEPVVLDLIRTEDLYQGDYLDDLPDFIVEWNRKAPISCVSSPRIGTLRKTFTGIRNGDHKSDGFFWVVGRSIEAGRQLDPVSVMDFAPTVASLLGVTLAEVEGKPLSFVSS